MYCKKCGIENEEDALYCKRCGAALIEQYEKKEKEKKPKQKVKTKTKVKTKVKKKKTKPSKRNNKKQVVTERKMGLLSKIVMFFLILLVLALAGISCLLGYRIYSDENIEVPDVTMMTYEEAESTLLEKNLNIDKKEKLVEEEAQDGVVIEQNKKPGKKVSKNTVIKVTVGVLNPSINVPNVVGMSLDQAKNTLNHINISYSISYKEVEEEEDSIVLSQNPKKGNKIEKNEKVLLTVSKKKTTSTTPKEENQEEEKEETSNQEIE